MSKGKDLINSIKYGLYRMLTILPWLSYCILLSLFVRCPCRVAVRLLCGLQEVGNVVCHPRHFLVPFEHGGLMVEKAHLLVIVQPVQGVGEVHHVRPASRKLPQTVHLRNRKPLSRPVVESPCPYEVAACHAALSGGAFNL